MGGGRNRKRSSSRPAGRPGPAGRIDPEELTLWKAITSGVKPLGGKVRRTIPQEPRQEVATPPEAKGPRRRSSLPRAQPVPLAPRPTSRPLLGAAVPAGLDRKTAQRLGRGQLPIDATLDLHGMSQAAAATALDGFLAAALRRGARCLLVVTGKGRGGGGSGVLRQRLPTWLEASVHRDAILALTPARPQHGGGGAFYLLLRRQREARSGPARPR